MEVVDLLFDLGRCCAAPSHLAEEGIDCVAPEVGAAALGLPLAEEASDLLDLGLP